MVLFTIFVVLSIFVISIIVYSFLKKEKTCNNKPCAVSSDCTECGGSDAICYEGRCCEPKSCLYGNCSTTDGCGNACATCATGEICTNGTCCTCQECDGKYCGPCTSCGGALCTCPEGSQCIDNQCCEVKACENDFCGDAGCGQTCGCGAFGHCDGNKCNYGDICNIVDRSQSAYMEKQWAQFCKPSTVPAKTSCNHCILTNAKFIGNALAPVRGTITCTECQDDSGKWKDNPTPIHIDPNVGYYKNVDGEIVAGKTVLGQKYCSEIGCDNCYCITDDDCRRFGCTSCGSDNKCV